jgi:anaphase-promoting complex subunit 1
LFDQRWDGHNDRSILGICLPASETLLTFSLIRRRDEKKYESVEVAILSQLPAISIASIRATREKVWDAIIVKPDGRLTLLTHGLREIPLQLEGKVDRPDLMDVDGGTTSNKSGHTVIGVESVAISSVTIVYNDGSKSRTSIDLIPNDLTTSQVLQVLAQTLPAQYCFSLHRAFLEVWSSRHFSMSDGVEFDCFEAALAHVFNLRDLAKPHPARDLSHAWQALSHSSSHERFRADPALARLELPSRVETPKPSRHPSKPHKLLAPILYALHTMGEDMRLVPHRYEDLLRLVSLICRVALVIRPEWADYWKRLCPDAMAGWPTSATTGECDFQRESSQNDINYISHRTSGRSYACVADRHVGVALWSNQ